MVGRVGVLGWAGLRVCRGGWDCFEVWGLSGVFGNACMEGSVCWGVGCESVGVGGGVGGCVGVETSLKKRVSLAGPPASHVEANQEYRTSCLSPMVSNHYL